MPPNAPLELRDLQTLCHTVEQTEDRSTKWKTARTAREIIVALPRELKLATNVLLIREFITKCFIEEGMCAVLAIHRGDNKREKNIEGDHKKIPLHNLHAHILLTTRSVDRDGFGLKVRKWDKKKFLKNLRKEWADHQNKIFEREGLDVSVSHLSYKAQGLDRKPGVHLGPVLTALEIEKGIKTKFGDANRKIEARNKEREEQEQNRDRGL